VTKKIQTRGEGGRVGNGEFGGKVSVARRLFQNYGRRFDKNEAQ